MKSTPTPKTPIGLRDDQIPDVGSWVFVKNIGGTSYAGRLECLVTNEDGNRQINIRDGAGSWRLETRQLIEISVIDRARYLNWNAQQLQRQRDNDARKQRVRARSAAVAAA